MPRPLETTSRYVRRCVQALAVLMSGVILATTGYGWAGLNHLTQSVDQLDIGGDNTPDVDGADRNILLIGDDHRPTNVAQSVLDELHAGTAEDVADLNTDTMMLLHVPSDGSRATVISLPRDSWVSVPGYGHRKLNSAFSLGSKEGGDASGMKLLIRTIQNITGLKIDHFVRVSLIGFYSIAKELGPIKVCLNEAVSDEYSGADFPAGEQELDAAQALAFVRQRHGLPDGDLDRQVRQQYFMSAALQKVVSSGVLLNPARVQRLLDAVSGALQTDPGLNLVTFAQQMQNVTAGNVRYATIPVTGTPTIEGDDGEEISIVSVDWLAMPAFIATVIGEPQAYKDANTITHNKVPVDVVNASGIYGSGTTAAETLKVLGFRPRDPEDSDNTTNITTITYPPGLEAQAKTLAKSVPDAIVGMDKVRRVTLTLGIDGVEVPDEVSGESTTTTTTAPPTTTESSSPAQSASSTTTTAPDSLDRTFTSADCIN